MHYRKEPWFRRSSITQQEGRTPPKRKPSGVGARSSDPAFVCSHQTTAGRDDIAISVRLLVLSPRQPAQEVRRTPSCAGANAFLGIRLLLQLFSSNLAGLDECPFVFIGRVRAEP